MHFPARSDAYRLGDRGHAVLGIKAVLNEKFNADLDTGSALYDQATVDAVKMAQKELGIGADGAFGRLTYKGSVTYEAGEARSGAAQAPAEQAPAENTQDTGEPEAVSGC
ncbi:hypothetical protein GCM10007079_33160 [Nocardiopsis terrae]|uniref:Murein L,D-transpeptidase YcbB/YkuD n=1 Tax=Nocardiopsis terrae TaxID=372655 RepID=A0ABR9HJD8_9ACTN|nr:hypothetical protein [Nocardiopsis terrae]MBE1459129.1 murein L,D-transpeptidase YcbB/YkuD [Nocardiopsis terrae]GHC88305.1 hypothetical protein GCM10007079_33160 [Nocardiopsis terrae]